MPRLIRRNGNHYRGVRVTVAGGMIDSNGGGGMIGNMALVMIGVAMEMIAVALGMNVAAVGIINAALGMRAPWELSLRPWE